jgi:predicted MPP superfamily phosphohydrolase
MSWALWVVCLVLAADTLRRVYGAGQTLNDHFVAAVVLGCMGFYAFQGFASPALWLPAWLAGAVGIWGLFFCIEGDQPRGGLLRWTLAVPSQLAYAFALWGGLCWLIRAPLAWALEAPVLWAGPALLLPLGLSLLGTIQARVRAHRVTRHRVPGLPGRLVQLSDLHASAVMHRPELDPLVDAVNALEPDLVVVTGDLVMPFSEPSHAYLIEALQRLEAPVVCCPGNHDLPVLQALRAELDEVGIPLLVDESVERAGFSISGVNFHWVQARAELERALERLSMCPGFPVLLAHDPRLGAWLPPGRFSLVLSGHTHGGQVAANMLGVPISALRLMGVRDQGWFDDRRHYVHAGNWLVGLPPRMGVAGEIAVFEPSDG